jgi:hypothetical protein
VPNIDCETPECRIIEGARSAAMRRFKWIDWNLAKIDRHHLSWQEVEAAFDYVFSLEERKDGSFQMFAVTPAGRRIWVIWRFDLEGDDLQGVLDELENTSIFVITAY